MKKGVLIFVSAFVCCLFGCTSSPVASNSLSSSTSSETVEHEHTFSNFWSYDETYHWREATCGHKSEIKDLEPHVFGEWIVDKEPTEKESGEKHKDCNVCGYTVFEEIDLLEHTHKAGDPVEEGRIEPTCTEDGSYDLVIYCTECGKELSREQIVIPATGHLHTTTREENRIEPTCTENGSYDVVTYCTDDEKEISRETIFIPSLGHDFGEWEITTPPTCEEEGEETRICSRDSSHVETRRIDATGHSWGSPVYSWASDYSSCTAERICAKDPEHKQSETKPSEYAVITPATKEKEGLGRYTVVFENPAFECQTQDIDLEQLGPYYGETPRVRLKSNTVAYGLYPQTAVDEETLLNALNGGQAEYIESNGWYFYNEAYYAKTKACPLSYTSNVFDNGNAIVEGTTYWFKCEPIIWTILSADDESYYLLSNVLLDAHKYDSEIYDWNGYHPCNYRHSNIRFWLNGYHDYDQQSVFMNDPNYDYYGKGFVDFAFALGDSCLQTTEVDNGDDTNTMDRVFLPGSRDYTNPDYGFASSFNSSIDTRCCKTTDWARARGAYYSSDFNGNYWLRCSGNPNYGGPQTWLVYYDGAIFDNGHVRDTSVCVRPAIHISVQQ